MNERHNIESLLNPHSPEALYFERLCALEDADESGAIDSGRRITALDLAVKCTGGNYPRTMEVAKEYYTFLCGGADQNGGA